MKQETFEKKVKDLDLFLEHGIIDKIGFNSELLIIQRLRIKTILEETEQKMEEWLKNR